MAHVLWLQNTTHLKLAFGLTPYSREQENVFHLVDWYWESCFWGGPPPFPSWKSISSSWFIQKVAFGLTPPSRELENVFHLVDWYWESCFWGFKKLLLG